jgi:hypothetical protein
LSVNRLSPPLLESLVGAFVALACVLVLSAPAAHARTGKSEVVWASPTKADQTRFSLKIGSKLTLRLTASSSIPETAVAIEALDGLPKGAIVNVSGGSVARAIFNWTPSEAGEYVIRFGASAGRGASAPSLTYIVDVGAKALSYPRSYVLTDDKVAHWAGVVTRVGARAKPWPSAKVVTTLATTTPDGTQNLVLVLSGKDVGLGKTWYRVRLPILPNNSTGWVPASALDDLTPVNTHLYIDRTKLTATLKRDGRTVFTSIIGVGKPFWPTPHGEFYIRNKLTNFDNPFYGPIAFGTNARSAVLTDWPGGGFVGIHGTSYPELLPGRVSHGCIRMQNADIRRLAQLMQVGTPLTIR